MSEEREYLDALQGRDAPHFERVLRPSRSLTNQGFAGIITLTSLGLVIPLFAVLGTAALWGLLPHMLLALGLLWYFLRRNDHDQTRFEHIRIWPDLIAVHRHEPRAPDRFFTANSYWVRTHLEDTRRTENYLTLRGGPREIELGAFLPPEARIDLRNDLESALARRVN